MGLISCGAAGSSGFGSSLFSSGFTSSAITSSFFSGSGSAALFSSEDPVDLFPHSSQSSSNGLSSTLGGSTASKYG